VPTLHTDIIQGDHGYEAFLESIRKINNPRNRAAVNYLRPALVGFRRLWFIPIHFIFGLIAGHFSPVLAILENNGDDEPLIAIFDVNDKYGLHLVPAKKLYESVKAKDLMTGKSRAVIIVSQ